MREEVGGFIILNPIEICSFGRVHLSKVDSAKAVYPYSLVQMKNLRMVLDDSVFDNKDDEEVNFNFYTLQEALVAGKSVLRMSKNTYSSSGL
jgi:hypothetical protein